MNVKECYEMIKGDYEDVKRRFIRQQDHTFCAAVLKG